MDVATQCNEVIDRCLATYHYNVQTYDQIGRLYTKPNAPAIWIDVGLFDLELKDYAYTDYTSQQNRLMHAHQGLLRFLWQDENDLLAQFELFLVEHSYKHDLKNFGANRSDDHIDPTPPEYNFAYYFEEVFGSKYIYALEPEREYYDRGGHRRFIDYWLTTTERSIAIELNGEQYHHPLATGKKQYRSQLFKQNSLVADGTLVYRWSNRGMADNERFKEQLREYFGERQTFAASPRFTAQRAVSFKLYEHQAQVISRISEERADGKDTFLVVLPTGTGKTEVLIEDFISQFNIGTVTNLLVIMPTRDLKQQTLTRFQKHVSNLRVGENAFDTDLQVVVQTSAYLTRHFSAIPSDRFGYIAVDEAHHAVAYGLRRVLEHFNPQVLLGLTATDQRLDQQKLEEVFGSYKVDLSLEQAIEQGIVPPIRVFRLQSNIDLSEVRFNGRDFLKQDLHRTVLIPSRDQLIADLLVEHFNEPLLANTPVKQGVVFCVDIEHAQRMAACLNASGISAQAVSGGDRAGLERYKKGEIRFLCACDLINEGWDAPQTSILIMARPTMSKVVYMQQLGRGTRRSAGKEALYVIDVVDSYGAILQPWSVHNLFQLGHYQPFANAINPLGLSPNHELLMLNQLYEYTQRIEPINVFNFEREFGDLLNEEQLARELFISTSTVKNWLKKGEITAAKSIPFGRSQLYYFSMEQLADIRSRKGIKPRTEASRRDDFFEFLEQRDYTFSYKIVFLLSFIELCNERGEVELPALTRHYQDFYIQLLNTHGHAEKAKNPLNELSNLENAAYMTRSLLQNPFEKFERKRFVYHCKDLNLVGFDPVLWEKLDAADLQRVRQQYLEDAREYFGKLGIELEHLSTSGSKVDLKHL
ncbi:MAG: DEAD/DEAH box helicase [Gammaproteobacteria bacterium]|nr:DEAD/DEAH box helicase [Gammaproteobacteria bacterium]